MNQKQRKQKNSLVGEKLQSIKNINDNRNENRNYYRQIFFVLGALLIMMFAMTSVDALARPRLVVSGVGVVDGIAAVGQDFTLAINVTDVDVVCAMSTVVSVQTNPPLNTRTTNSAAPVNICGGETKTVLIPMSVDPTAVGGSYLLPITLDFEDTLNTPYVASETLTLVVSGSPNLEAHIASSSPVDIYPGDTAMLTVQLENDGTFQAQAVNAELRVSPDSPIEIKPASSTFTAGVIDAKRSVNAVFAVEIPKNAAAQDYPLILRVSYLDENRVEKTTDLPLVLSAKQKALFSAQIDASQYLYSNDNGKTVVVNLKNIGTDTARNLKIKVNPQFPFTTDGSVRFVDSIVPGATVPVELVFNVDKDATVGSYGLELIMDFEDAQGKSLHDTTDMQIVVTQKGILRAVFLDYWYLWVIAIIIFAIVYRRRMRAKATASATHHKK